MSISLTAPPTASPTPSVQLKFSPVATTKGQRIGIYGVPGIGKTSLITTLPGKTVVFDADSSLGVLKKSGIKLDNTLTAPAESFEDILNALNDQSIWDGVNNIVIDTITRVEKLAIEYVLKTFKSKKGERVNNITEYGFGDGFRLLFDQMLKLFASLEQHALRHGRNIIIIAHSTACKAPNPTGDDYLRYEPQLTSSEKQNTKSYMMAFLDHLLFINYEVAAVEGKAKGNGTRIIYPVETATHMAKSRILKEAMFYKANDNTLWEKIL